MRPATLLVCHECDALQRAAEVPPGRVVRCVRCDALLYRNPRNGLDRTLALALTAAVTLLLANVFPIVGLELHGSATETTLLGAVRAVEAQDKIPVAAVVLLTTIVAPALEILALLYLLLPLRLGRVPRHAALVSRVLHALTPWAMAEVFLIGLLVAMVKLARLATVVPGIGLWSLGVTIVLFAAATYNFEPHQLWRRIEALR